MNGVQVWMFERRKEGTICQHIRNSFSFWHRFPHRGDHRGRRVEPLRHVCGIAYFTWLSFDTRVIYSRIARLKILPTRYVSKFKTSYILAKNFGRFISDGLIFGPGVTVRNTAVEKGRLTWRRDFEYFLKRKNSSGGGTRTRQKLGIEEQTK